MPLKRIHISRDAMEAHFLCGLLQAEGISAVVMGESLSNAMGLIPAGAATAPSVWVNQEDVQRASEFIARFNRNANQRVPAPKDASWICPNCGEAIEGQFTDCWNCTRPRPAAGEPADAIDPGPPDATLNCDVPCIQCGYNLRGLTPTNRCPECGLPILRSLLDMLRFGMPPEAEELDRLVRRPFELAAPVIGFPASGLILICHAWMCTLRPIELSGDDPAPNPALFARRICDAVRDDAIDFFGGVEEAKAGFNDWSINGSDEIGRIARGLMDAGLLEPVPNDVVAEFNGLFDMDGLFSPDS